MGMPNVLVMSFGGIAVGGGIRCKAAAARKHASRYQHYDDCPHSIALPSALSSPRG
jgi:hypothetical protein